MGLKKEPGLTAGSYSRVDLEKKNLINLLMGTLLEWALKFGFFGLCICNRIAFHLHLFEDFQYQKFLESVSGHTDLAQNLFFLIFYRKFMAGLVLEKLHLFWLKFKFDLAIFGKFDFTSQVKGLCSSEWPKCLE